MSQRDTPPADRPAPQAERCRLTVLVSPDCSICQGSGVRRECVGGTVYTTAGIQGTPRFEDQPCYCARLHIVAAAPRPAPAGEVG